MRIKECILETIYVCIHSDSSHGHYIIPILSACTVSKSEPLTATYHIFALYVTLRVLRIDIFHTALIAAVVLNVREETSCCNLQYFHWNCAVPSQYPVLFDVSSDGKFSLVFNLG